MVPAAWGFEGEGHSPVKQESVQLSVGGRWGERERRKSMSYSNRELVEYFVSYKLAQKNYSIAHILQDEANEQTEQSGGGEGEAAGAVAHANGSVSSGNSVGQGAPLEGATPQGLEAVKEALRLSANEFEFRYQRAFSDLSSQLHITPATAYQSFESVMNEVFRDGVNWGRVVGLFAFGGALCVECVEKEMSPLVGHIVDWMTVYLDSHIQPWIQTQGGWVSPQQIQNQGHSIHIVNRVSHSLLFKPPPLLLPLHLLAPIRYNSCRPTCPYRHVLSEVGVPIADTAEPFCSHPLLMPWSPWRGGGMGDALGPDSGNSYVPSVSEHLA